MNKLKWATIIFFALLFIDLNLTAIVFGGRVLSLIALALLLVFTGVVCFIIIKD